jgi:hypothetical protein
MLRREIRNYPSHIFLSSKMGVLNVQRCKTSHFQKVEQNYLLEKGKNQKVASLAPPFLKVDCIIIT